MVLRIIHFFSGVFWVGFAMFNFFFFRPTIKATGENGQKTMQYLLHKTRLFPTVYTAATLTMLSGLVLYWIYSGFRISFISTEYGVVLTIGSIAGIIAWIIAVMIIRGIFSQIQIIGQKIQASDGPPSPELADQMQVLNTRLGKMGKMAVSFLIIALLGMSIAQYSPF
jgi:uncharacterized membrane protein